MNSLKTQLFFLFACHPIKICMHKKYKFETFKPTFIMNCEIKMTIKIYLQSSHFNKGK
jgi:hypothetical protein